MLNAIRNRIAEIFGVILWGYVAVAHGGAIWAFTKYLYGSPVVFALVFYGLFLIYACWFSAKERGEIIPREAEAILAPILAYGAILDVSWRNLFGTWLHFGWDPVRSPKSFADLTFTSQLKRWKLDPGWRGMEARWFKGMLDWAQTGEHV